MKRDIWFLATVSAFILILFVGIFVRGIKEQSLIENKMLATFPAFSKDSFFDTSFQSTIEEALTDQIILGGTFKTIYNKVKDNNVELVVTGLKSLEKSMKNSTRNIENSELIENDKVSMGGAANTENTDVVVNSSNDESTTSDNSSSYNNSDNSSNSSNSTNSDNSSNNSTNSDSSSNSSTNNYYEFDNIKAEKLIEANVEVIQPIIIKREPEYNTFEIDLTPRANNMIEIDETNHLIYRTKTVDEAKVAFKRKAENFNDLVSKYPEINYYCYYIEVDIDVDFINGVIDHALVESYFSLFDPAIKTHALYINQPEEFENYFYKTDHHWNVLGQQQGYLDTILLLKGENEPVLDLKIVDIPDALYNGSRSRTLNDYSIKDEFKILVSDLPPYKTFINGVEGEYDHRDMYLKGEFTRGTGLNYYAECNGGDYGLVEFQFDQPEEGNLLVFVESFSNPINGFIASHFNNTYFVDFRHYQPTFGKTFDFSEFIAEHNITDVLYTGYYSFHANNVFLVTD